MKYFAGRRHFSVRFASPAVATRASMKRPRGCPMRSASASASTRGNSSTFSPAIPNCSLILPRDATCRSPSAAGSTKSTNDPPQWGVFEWLPYGSSCRSGFQQDYRKVRILFVTVMRDWTRLHDQQPFSVMNAHHINVGHRSLPTLPVFSPLTPLLLCAGVMVAADPPEPAIAFGLPNLPLGQALINYNEVSNLGSNGTDGVSIFLGEADNGVFFYPNTSDQPEGGDYMLGKTYGRVDGVNGYPISIVRGRKVGGSSGFGVYPVEVDFTSLGVTNLTFQVFAGRQLVAQHSVSGGETVVRTDFNGGSIIRANPWWGMPDGRVGGFFV